MEVYIVTIRKCVSSRGDKIDAMPFYTREEAEAWIEAQIDSHVNDLKLDRGSVVNGWKVKLDGERRAICYSIVKRELQPKENTFSKESLALWDEHEKQMKKKRQLFNREFGERYGVKLMLLQAHCNPQGQRFVDVDFLFPSRKTAEEIEYMCENIANWIGGDVRGTVNFDFAGRASISICVEMFEEDDLREDD